MTTDLKILKEEWRPIKGIEDFYHVSNKGYIKRLKRYVPNGKGYKLLNERVYKGRICKGMYVAELHVEGKKYSYSVARLVYNTFNDTILTNHYQIFHKDGNLKNNNISNLCAISKRENNRSGKNKTTGVSYRNGSFYAHISFESVNVMLHCSKNENECNKIYQSAKTSIEEYYKLKNKILSNRINNKLINKSTRIIEKPNSKNAK